MCAVMIAWTPASIAARNGSESLVLDRFDDRELVMGVLGRVAVPRKVLRACSDACALQTANERGDVPARPAALPHRTSGCR